MFDLSVRLRANAHLLSLLSHYARLGSEDRTAWRDRLMRMDGVGTEQLIPNLVDQFLRVCPYPTAGSPVTARRNETLPRDSV